MSIAKPRHRRRGFALFKSRFTESDPGSIGQSLHVPGQSQGDGHPGCRVSGLSRRLSRIPGRALHQRAMLKSVKEVYEEGGLTED